MLGSTKLRIGNTLATLNPQEHQKL